ncbi:MAG: DUF362 domain-containing protein [PVC group bacterium]|nr:DUF362 domain-containing protein [PVC group bacterium]
MKSKVSIVKCSDYDKERIYKAVKGSIDLIGGIEAFVKPGQKVLLKPNLLKVGTPEEAVVTHPEMIRAVIRLVKTQTDKIFVGDSPAGLIKAESVYEKSGIADVCRQEKVTLVKFDRFIKIDGIPFTELIKEVDVLISLPKFKTHNLTTITGAIKNVFGLIPGLYKVECHKKAPNFKVFSAMLAKIYSHVPAQLNIVDSILAMEGDGPAAGKPRFLGFVLASADAVAADAVLTKIIGLNPFDIISTKAAYRLKLGEADLKKIEVVGESIAAVKIQDFALPKIVALYKVPNIISRIFMRLVPLIIGVDYKKCSNCMMCKNSCPQDAIQEVGGKLKVNCRKCILCLCCGEICPNNAIYMRFLNRRVKS